MPYVLHERVRVIRDECDIAPADRLFETRAKAHAAKSDSLFTITFVPSVDEIATWRAREHERFRTGEYVPVPWHERSSAAIRLHYAHLSLKIPGMVAYTPDPEHGIQDRQLRLRPGRYLAKFYRDYYTDPNEIAGFVSACDLTSPLQLARTAADITQVYTEGPDSCMSGKNMSNGSIETAEIGIHPAVVYAEPSDLAVAYHGPLGCASQRAVVWPEKKLFYRIYGTGPLEAILRRNGYEHGSLKGARILAIRYSNGYILPYIDGALTVGLQHGFLVLGAKGFPTDVTCGYTEEFPDSCRCGRCETEIGEDETYCDSCLDDRWTCVYCNRESFVPNAVYQIGDSEDNYCARCRARYCRVCTRCDHEWIETTEFTQEQCRDRRARNQTDLCYSCYQTALDNEESETDAIEAVFPTAVTVCPFDPAEESEATV